jgi:FixJ family two-component response regulator
MQKPSLLVYVIDDDASVRIALERLMRSAGLEVAGFDSVETFFDQADPERRACIVADVRMPGTIGLDLPGLLLEKGWHDPVIFVTADDTEEMRRLARVAGAASFFHKPVDDQALLDAIHWALSLENHTAT